MTIMTAIGETDRIRKLGIAYSPQYPCPSELFAGRREHLDHYKLRVLVPKYPRITPAPTNVAYLGPWGVGKTSLLELIAGSKEFRDRSFVNLSVIRDFGGIDDLLNKTLINIAVSVSRLEWLKEKVLKKLEGVGISPFSIKIADSRPALTDLLIKTWGVLEEAGVQHCSILIDDFHLLSDADMLTLRNIFQHLPREGCNYSLVVTGTPTTFAAEPTEPVARFFYKPQLEPFTLEETEEALEKPVDTLKIDLSFDEKYVGELQELTLGYPYFVKFITLELAVRYEKLKVEHLKKHRRELIDALGKAKFEIDYSRRSPTEKNILRTLAEKNLTRFQAKELKHIPNYSKYLERLCADELLNWEERGMYSVYHPLFLEWLRVLSPYKGSPTNT